MQSLDWHLLLPSPVLALPAEGKGRQIASCRARGSSPREVLRWFRQPEDSQSSFAEKAAVTPPKNPIQSQPAWPRAGPAGLHTDPRAPALTFPAIPSPRMLGRWDVLHGDNQLPLVLVETSSICPNLPRGENYQPLQSSHGTHGVSLVCSTSPGWDKGLGLS